MSPFTFMKLIFENTGDELHFQETNTELLEYYKDTLGASNNFIPTTVNDSLEKLQNCLDIVDDFFVTKLKDNTFSNITDLYKQSVLNNLHSIWVKKQVDSPAYVKLLDRAGIFEEFKDINVLIHKIEEHDFRQIYMVDSKFGWQCKNIFGNKILNFNRCNISLDNYNLGRQTYDKWWKYDDNVLDDDTNDYELLGGRLLVDLQRPHSLQPPKEYVDWCNSNNIQVVGYRCGLGNFTKDIDTQREVFQKNRQNSFKII